MAAEINARGNPSNEGGGLALSVYLRIPQKSTMASKKPSPAPSALVSEGRKPRPSEMLVRVTAIMAQLVVISGRKTPNDLYKAGR